MLALALALCLDAAIEPAALPPGPVELRWDAPAACPTEGEVRASLDAMLRGAAPPEASLSVDARVTGTPGAYVLDLAVVSAAGRDARTIRAARCEPLGRAAALVAATLVDPVTVADY
ncbi:MAG: hypothetical protein KDK70_11470, partial [Myxococcales bacterium]|nr:hypothetical protein [Myxococcales bacterium]